MWSITLRIWDDPLHQIKHSDADVIQGQALQQQQGTDMHVPAAFNSRDLLCCGPTNTSSSIQLPDTGRLVTWRSDLIGQGAQTALLGKSCDQGVTFTNR